MNLILSLLTLIKMFLKQELDPLKLFGIGGHYTEYGYQKISYKIYEKTQ